jgi:SAM-dependent methyltransferase
VSTTDNHRSWAEHYDEVNRQCFGDFYDQLTQQTLAQIGSLGPKLRIADFGAGTGRLSLPLMDLGHEVSAIEPSKAMLEQLRAKDRSRRIQTYHASLSSYDGPGQHDLALAVFTVIAYILTPEELTASFANAARALTPEGHLLIDVPRRILFNSNKVDRPGLIRDITFTPRGGNLFTYAENTSLETPDGPFDYADQFTLRYWTQDEVRSALRQAGLHVTADWSGAFTAAGAEYWLCAKNDPAQG